MVKEAWQTIKTESRESDKIGYHASLSYSISVTIWCVGSHMCKMVKEAWQTIKTESRESDKIGYHALLSYSTSVTIWSVLREVRQLIFLMGV